MFPKVQNLADTPIFMTKAYQHSDWEDRKALLLGYAALIITAIAIATFQAYTGSLSSALYKGMQGGILALGIVFSTPLAITLLTKPTYE